MSNKYWNDQNNAEFYGNPKDRQLSKGQPNKSTGTPGKTDAKFTMVEDTNYTNERKK